MNFWGNGYFNHSKNYSLDSSKHPGWYVPSSSSQGLGQVSCGSWLPQHTGLLAGFGDRGQKAVKPTFPLMEHTKHPGRGENHKGHTCHVPGTLPGARL